MSGSAIFFICCWGRSCTRNRHVCSYFIHKCWRGRIASPAEQFLLFGADVDDSSDIVTICFEKLVCDLDLVTMQIFFEKNMFWVSSSYKNLTLIFFCIQSLFMDYDSMKKKYRTGAWSFFWYKHPLTLNYPLQYAKRLSDIIAR